MTVTAYAPDAHLTAGNTLIGVAPAIAAIASPTVVELTASTMIQCATEAFGSTTATTKRTRKMICDLVGTEALANRTYSMDDLIIMLGNPQEANDILDLLVQDSTLWFWVRPGSADTEAIAAADKVEVIEATIDAVDLRTISTADGDEFAVVVKVSVSDRTQLFGTVTA